MHQRGDVSPVSSGSTETVSLDELLDWASSPPCEVKVHGRDPCPRPSAYRIKWKCRECPQPPACRFLCKHCYGRLVKGLVGCGSCRNVIVTWQAV